MRNNRNLVRSPWIINGDGLGFMLCALGCENCKNVLFGTGFNGDAVEFFNYREAVAQRCENVITRFLSKVCETKN